MIDGLQIGTLRARASAGEAAARLPIERALAAADLRPPGLPAGAVLIVRRLATGQPSPRPAWERAVRAQLAALCRRATRPARGECAAGAEAVFFADEAELLACLADDIVANLAATRWWWRSYLRGRPAHITQLPALLAARTVALPAALSLLAARKRVATVLCALQPSAAYALAERLAATYGAGTLSLSALPDIPGEARPRHSGRESATLPEVRSASPPWPTLLPELPREQQLLLGLALSILARPAAPRAPAFRRALAAWWRASGQSRSHPLAVASAQAQSAALSAPFGAAPHGDVPTPAPVSGPMLRTDVEAQAEPALPTPAPGAPPTSAPARRADPHQMSAATEAAADPPGPIGSVATPVPPPRPAHTATPALSSPPASHTAPVSLDQMVPPVTLPDHTATPAAAILGGDPESGHAPPAEPAPAPASPWQEFESGQPTELGGALFLINLLLYLGLPEQFAPAWPLERAVGAWGLLELFARGLLADPAAYADDPIWRALAQLDGRPPGVAPGAGAAPVRLRWSGRRHIHRLRRGRLARAPRDYRIPPARLRGLPDDPAERFRWAASRRRLRIWSSRGYVLFDGCVRRPGLGAARAVLAELGLADPPLARSRFGRSSGGYWPSAMESLPAWLRRWLHLAMPYARLRLALALGLDPSEALDGSLLARRGRLFISATHLDLALNLESTSIAVRLAGLDRNPGWIAEYGRVVLFHFVVSGEQEVE